MCKEYFEEFPNVSFCVKKLLAPNDGGIEMGFNHIN
jgi:hypothetical protein